MNSVLLMSMETAFIAIAIITATPLTTRRMTSAIKSWLPWSCRVGKKRRSGGFAVELQCGSGIAKREFGLTGTKTWVVLLIPRMLKYARTAPAAKLLL